MSKSEHVDVLCKLGSGRMVQQCQMFCTKDLLDQSNGNVPKDEAVGQGLGKLHTSFCLSPFKRCTAAFQWHYTMAMLIDAWHRQAMLLAQRMTTVVYIKQCLDLHHRYTYMLKRSWNPC